MLRFAIQTAAISAGFIFLACASNGAGTIGMADIDATVVSSIASREPPVYNAVFTPSKSGAPLTLTSGQPTQVRFFIARPDVQNAIPANKWTVDREILASRNPHLTITLICLVCAGDELQKKPITYFRNEGYSSEAVFSFTPLRDRTATGTGQVIFSVEHDGIERNHVVLDVVVDAPLSNTESAATTIVLPLDQTTTITTRTQDVTIDISRSAAGYVEVTVTPSPTSRIYNDLAALAFANGDPRRFTTTLSVGDLEKWTRRTYLDLWDLVQLQQSALKNIYHGRPGGDLRLPPSAPVRMTDSDRDTALQKLRDLGKYLYGRLFRDGDPALQELMADIELLGTHGTPLRVVINTTGIYAPWQLLHPLTGDADRFWGLTYDLSVRPTAIRRGPADLAPEPRMTSAIFGQYSDPADADGITGLAAAEAQWLGARVPENSLHVAANRDEFLSALTKHRTDVLLVMTLGHALRRAVGRRRGATPAFRAEHVCHSRERLQADTRHRCANAVLRTWCDRVS
jgi:hypothetical protein